MPIVTPNWNLPTPALSDAYNLVGDLATFSTAVDGALTTVANARKGTAAQRIAVAATTQDGVLWQDTDGIKMLWRRDGSVSGSWAPAVTRWIGTTAQMNAFTQAPNGFEWFNTNNSSNYTRYSGTWTPMYPSSETVRGVWVDGKTLYQQVFSGVISQSGGVRNLLTVATGVDKLVRVEGYWTGSDGGKYPFSQTTGNDSLTSVFHFSYLVATPTNNLLLTTRSDQVRTNAPYVLSAWYTKT